MLKERIAIIDGLRSPMAKAGTDLKTMGADDLGAHVLRELLQKAPVDPLDIDEVIVGNVAQPSHAANIARVIGIKSGLSKSIPAVTVHRNCASGMEAISVGAAKLLSGEAKLVVAGGTESMSHIPLLYSDKMVAFFDRLNRAKTVSAKLKVLASFRLPFLKPRIGLIEGLTDPTCGLIMGLTAENLSKEFKIDRLAQDEFALESHRRAILAKDAGVFTSEIVATPVWPKLTHILTEDTGPRREQSLEALAKLKPYFDRENGTVTVGNACPITDGAAMLILTTESHAKMLGITPLGYVKDYAYAGLDPHRMGLGPVFAAAKVFAQSGLAMTDMDLVEINEAFAAQVLGCTAAFESAEFAKKELGLDKPVGAVELGKLNVNGGAIAMGHPVGMTGTRLVLTMLKELKRRQVKRGLASLCVGGGQGAAFIVEAD